MRVEKTSRRAPPKLMQHGKEVEVGVELALGGELLGVAVERDAVHLDVTVLARPGAARQPSLGDPAAAELHAANLRQHPAAAPDLAHPLPPLPRSPRRPPA